MPPANSPVELLPSESRWGLTLPPMSSQSGTSIHPSSIAPSFPQPSDDIDDENVSFLRRPYNPEEDEALERIQRAQRTAEQERRHYSQAEQERRLMSLDQLSRNLREERRRRSQRTSGRIQGLENTLRAVQTSTEADLPRFSPSEVRRAQREAEREREQGRVPYGNSAPSQQSMYDWAPEPQEDEFSRAYARLRADQPNTHPEVLRALAQSTVDEERMARYVYRETSAQTPSTIFGRRLDPHEHSLRSAAILRDVRRNQALSARSRDLMSRYVMERERAVQADRAIQETNMNNSRPTQMGRPTRVSVNDSNRYELNRIAWQATTRPTYHSYADDNVETLRRRYLDNPTSKSSSEFEKVIQYLHIMRNSGTDLEIPLEHLDGFQAEKPPPWHSAERLNMRIACPPHPSSWLVPGMTFTGGQHAGSPMLTHEYTLPPIAQSGTEPLDALRPWLSSHTSQAAPFTISPTTLPSEHHLVLASPDRWVMKVSIHDVDYDNMTLQGTMEAFNVPTTAEQASSNMNSASNKTTYSTYLTGELIDFHKHTLLTVSHPTKPLTNRSGRPASPPSPQSPNGNLNTTADIDAKYWRKLEPFSQLSDDEIAKVLLDPQWIEREIAQKYILMRWKERCFVAPTYEAREGTVWEGGQRPDPPSERSAVFLPGVLAGSSVGMSGRGGAAAAGGGDGWTNFRPIGAGQFGLSISGFYYVSLRRSDGRLEGLYFDPQSAPYQHLEMKPERKFWMGGNAEIR